MKQLFFFTVALYATTVSCASYFTLALDDLTLCLADDALTLRGPDTATELDSPVLKRVRGDDVQCGVLVGGEGFKPLYLTDDGKVVLVAAGNSRLLYDAQERIYRHYDDGDYFLALAEGLGLCWFERDDLADETAVANFVPVPEVPAFQAAGRAAKHGDIFFIAELVNRYEGSQRWALRLSADYKDGDGALVLVQTELGGPYYLATGVDAGRWYISLGDRDACWTFTREVSSRTFRLEAGSIRATASGGTNYVYLEEGDENAVDLSAVIDGSTSPDDQWKLAKEGEVPVAHEAVERHPHLVMSQAGDKHLVLTAGDRAHKYSIAFEGPDELSGTQVLLVPLQDGLVGLRVYSCGFKALNYEAGHITLVDRAGAQQLFYDGDNSAIFYVHAKARHYMCAADGYVWTREVGQGLPAGTVVLSTKATSK